MQAENLETLRENLLNKGRMEGRMEGEQYGADKSKCEIARTEMSDQMIAEITGLPAEEVIKLRSEGLH